MWRYYPHVMVTLIPNSVSLGEWQLLKSPLISVSFPVGPWCFHPALLRVSLAAGSSGPASDLEERLFIHRHWDSLFCAFQLDWISSLIPSHPGSPTFLRSCPPVGLWLSLRCSWPSHAEWSVLKGKAIKQESHPVWFLSFQGWPTSSFSLISVALQWLQTFIF